VFFTGEPDRIADVLYLFFEQCGHNEDRLPAYVTAENRAMIDIEFYNNGRVYYRTPWEPNLEALQQIADHHGVGFVNRYSEPDMFLWGEATYEKGQGKDIRLERSDYSRCVYNSEYHYFIYNGKGYECDHEAFEEMLDDKIRVLAITQMPGQNTLTR
jgi:hypothetical protein